MSDEISPQTEKYLNEKNIIKTLRETSLSYLQTFQSQLIVNKRTLIMNEQSINKLVYTVANSLECPLYDKLRLL